MNGRRGYVVLIRGGDPEISGGIVDGIMKARGDTSSGAARHLPIEGKALGETESMTGEQVEVVEAEIDRQRIQRALLRVAVGNTNTAEDYANMTTKARGDYAVDARRPGPLRRLGAFLLGAYALIVLGLVAAYRAQDRVLMAGCGGEATHPALRATSPFRGGMGRR